MVSNQSKMEEIPDKPAFDRRTYMREYKRAKYAEEAGKKNILDINKVQYYKKKYNLSNEYVDKYGVFLPIVSSAKHYLDELRIANPEMFQTLLAEYTTGWLCSTYNLLHLSNKKMG